MLGRRAAVIATIFCLAAFGGGAAVAATHGSSSSSKSHATKPQVTQKQRSTRSGTMQGHHCPNMGSSSASYSPAL